MRNGLALGLVATGFGVVGLVLAFVWDASRSGPLLALAGVALLIAVVFVGLSVRATRSTRD
ncbi:hypothetical protein [Curtobacterium sp. UCD-KPL2560]|uniref:hypothetical protein n=1 Tax=Curtobacterium sp. UCD-KPL2560 TaxID=1885315 RepID=UPI0008257393|nr:hypothetical protein [Curtobacterium sp. UCD-KPL2560]